MVVALVRRLSEAAGETRARRRRKKGCAKNSITGLRVLGAWILKVLRLWEHCLLVGLQNKRSVKWVLGLAKRERERNRRKGDSLYTEGIRRRMINYWYSVVTALSVMCCVGLFFFSFLFFS